MWRLLLCVMACVLTAAGAAELRCVHPECVLNNQFGIYNEFLVEGHKVCIGADEGNLYLDCGKKRTLSSPALPRFTNIIRVKSVTLILCAPPVAGSFADALAALNVTLDTDAESDLWIEGLPSEPRLTDHHFHGFTHLMKLGIRFAERYSRPLPTSGFLKDLHNLRLLMLISVPLPTGEQINAPLLHSLTLTVDSIEQLPTTLLTLPKLRELVLREEKKKIGMFPGRTVTMLAKNLIGIDQLPTLETLELVDWTEPQPSALTRCDALQKFKLDEPAAKELPERWVAACPHLSILMVVSALNLVSLPSKLLEDASALTHLVFKKGVLETLPEGLFDATPNLHTVDFTKNRLHALPSGVFMGQRALRWLDLSYNQLESEALYALAPLHDLRVLNVSHNLHLGDLCDYHGYSPLLNSTKLMLLSLSQTNISRICRDWRENMTFLATLDLQNTQISELLYDDLQYKRNAEITNAEVKLQGAPVTTVLLTEDDYKRSLTAPASHATVELDSKLECGCRMYWTRLALDHENHTIQINGTLCKDNRVLTDLTVDDMCPEYPVAMSLESLPMNI